MDRRSVTRAIGVMCVGVFFLALNDALAKLLVERYSPFQILFVRSLAATLMLIPFIVKAHGLAGFKTRTPGVHALRGLASLAATFAFIHALSQLPLAVGTALIFTAPLFVAVLSFLVFREALKWVRTAAVIAGFAGALIIIRPDTDSFEPAALWALLAALLNATLMLSARFIHRNESFLTLMFYMSVVPAALCTFTLGSDWGAVSWRDAGLFAGLAIFGTLGISMISQSFRMAPAATVAPFDYGAILWASLWGYLFWTDLPGASLWIGAVIIIASGLVVLRSEQRYAADPD